MKKRILLALIVLIAFLSIGIISASEISVNDTYIAQDSSENLLAVDEGGVESNSSNILSINNVDTNLDENTIGENELARESVIIDAPDIELYYKNGTKFTATLTDVDGNGLVNQSLIFTISGVDYLRSTDIKGQASIAINLIPGIHDINIYYNGNEYFLPNETTAKCTVLPTITGEDLVKYYKNDTQYYATFLDGQGNPLANTDINFNINGVFYERKTNANGIARLNINLLPGEYILTAMNPNDGFSCANYVTVMSTIYSEDLTKVYNDPKKFTVALLDDQGNPLPYVNATFNINGVFYNRTSDESGIAALNIRLLPKDYIITTYHPNGLQTANTVKVLGSSSTTFLTEDYEYFASQKQIISTTLVDQLDFGIADQDVVISAGSASVNTKTDSHGTAVATFELISGEYTVEYQYYGVSPYQSSKATSKLTVREGIPLYFDISNTTIYYNNKETFDVTVHPINNTAGVVNKPVYFTINGVTYSRLTDEKGTARLAINLSPGNYDVTYRFNSTPYEDTFDSTQILVIDGNVSTLTGSNITVGQGDGEKFPVYLDVGDVALPYRDVIFNINGINYTRTTDEYGIAQLTINLGEGKYLIKYYYAGEDRIEPSSGQAYVTVKQKIETSLEWSSSTIFVGESDINLMVTLRDKDNKPLASKDICFEIGSKTYFATTDKDGIALVNVELSKGKYLVSYTFDGDDDYLSSMGTTEITVSDSYTPHGYGYWSFGADMYNIDLANFASLGTTDIFLNFYAFELHGESAVVSWIQNANSYGINIHIWMQVFYSGGSWVNPVSGGSINQGFFNEVIEEAKYYAGLSGVAGIHFDYLRYPGTAYNTPGGTAAITEFVRQATTACREINPSIIMSAAIMPETNDDIYYYGQDVPAISQYLDAIVPMQYKGNYNTGSSWLASTTKWFVQNSAGAEVWSGLQAYISDDNPTKLTYTELFGDAQNVVDNGADGVILFRFGLSQFLNFNDLDSPAYGDTVSVNDVISGAAEIKDYIEKNETLPGKAAIGTSYYNVPQILYLMSQAILIINGDIPGDNITAIRVASPANVSKVVNYNQLSESQYINLASSISTYCRANNQVPDLMATSVGDITYAELVYLYSRVLTYYGVSNELPAMVFIGAYLEFPELTVSMYPSYSTEEYEYRNYTTTWLNYCPNCGYYGTLLINPKHTYEGEFTCCYCDCDYCGVTGHEKIEGSDKVLTRLSESVPVTPGGGGDTISIGSILTGASYIASYYKENELFPEYVVVSEGKYTMSQFLYLMSKAIVQINAGNFDPITLIDMDDPSNSGDVIDGYLTKDQYLDVESRVYKFIESNGVVPAYASSTLGKIAYSELVDASSRILDYYANNFGLPDSVHIVYASQPSKSIAELSKSLIAGLTTDIAKATALYNYVRDQIEYEFYYDTQKGAEGTLISGSGNCCDQAQLLVAMARSVGLTVRFDTGYCHFSSGSWYGHVWTQFLIDGAWINADPTSNRNSFGVINNWDTSSYTDRGTYDILPY
ncbi:transglutaminase domain-containing protein [uncultured Methanobrevibacter sp.]|uniref:transglutaminase domain-containing protein n=1 Tax=uncultured Methanobrevibacter sp. TaxID=253161 RepID=UPI0025DCEA2D|nr:transglutaminase domain-containing protein [uncultured Methanobrevibacter sp.]